MAQASSNLLYGEVLAEIIDGFAEPTEDQMIDGNAAVMATRGVAQFDRQWHEMAMDASGVANNGGRLLGPTTFSEDETRIQIVEMEVEQFLDGDCLAVDLALFSRIAPCAILPN